MGCNVFGHLATGYIDIQRTGDDTSGMDWERTKKYGVNTLAFRMCQHKAFYFVDADCVGITNDISWDKNSQWLDVLAKSGTPLFVSIAEDIDFDKIKNDIESAFIKASENGETSKPVDWMENKVSERWESTYGTDEYTW
jgi:alpha-galactosidase